MAEAKSPDIDMAKSAMLFDQKGLTTVPGDRRGFVSRFFIGGFGLRLLGYSGCGRRCWLGGPPADAWAAGSRLLQLAERAVGAFVDAMET